MSDDRQHELEQLSEDFFLFLWRVKEDTARIFRPLDMRPEQVFILELIERGLHHPKEIADALQWDPPLLSHYLAKLEDRGFIVRTLDPSDRRRTRIELSPEGRDTRKRARAAWRGFTARVLEGLGDAELEQLRGFIRRITRAQEGAA